MSTLTLTPSMEDLIDWARTQRWSQFAQSLVAQYERKGYLSDAQVDSLARMYAKVASKPSAPKPANPATEVGMYAKDGKVYRVKRSESGHLYAMLYDPAGATKSERFTYARGVVSTLSADDRMSVDQAEALGLKFGICCVCGAELTAEKSVGRGIGPVCAGRV